MWGGLDSSSSSSSQLTIQMHSPATSTDSTISAIQLQAVTHESLPGGGPGIGLGGSFRLGEVQMTRGASDADTAQQTVKFREVLTGDDDSRVSRLIDGNPATVWNFRAGGQAIAVRGVGSWGVKPPASFVLRS